MDTFIHCFPATLAVLMIRSKLQCFCGFLSSSLDFLCSVRACNIHLSIIIHYFLVDGYSSLFSIAFFTSKSIRSDTNSEKKSFFHVEKSIIVNEALSVFESKAPRHLSLPRISYFYCHCKIPIFVYLHWNRTIALNLRATSIKVFHSLFLNLIMFPLLVGCIW